MLLQDEAPSRPSSDRPGSRIFLNDEGRLVRVDEEEDGKDDDIMQQLAKSFRFFPSMVSGCGGNRSHNHAQCMLVLMYPTRFEGTLRELALFLVENGFPRLT